MRFWGYLSLLALVIGAFYFNNPESLIYAEWIFVCVSLFTLSGVFFWSINHYQDWFNPIAVILGTAFIRLGLPAILYLTSELPVELQFAFYQIPESYWHMGWTLAQLGMLSLVLGWFTAPEFLKGRAQDFLKSVTTRLPLDRPSVAIAAVLFMILGLIFTIVFLRANFSDIGQALLSGNIRGPEFRAAGTSRYNFLATWMLYTGSVVLSAYLLGVKRTKWWIGLIPAIGVLVVLTPFGGRVVAFTPLVYALIMLWYRSETLKVHAFRDTLVIIATVIFLVTYAAFVLAFRGGGGLEAGLQAISLNGIKDYMTFSVWSEIGTLHPFAFAAYFGPDVLDGGTYPLMGGFVTSILFGQPGISPGMFMVQQLIYSGSEWGYHTGLIIDLFMNTGFVAAMVGCFAFGGVLRIVYESFRRSQRTPILLAGYALFSWQALWFFYESISVVFTLAISFVFLIALLFLAEILPEPGKHKARAFRSLDST